MVSQGKRANANGRSAEDVIASILDRRKVAYIRQHRVGLGIFGTPIKVDFYCHPPSGVELGLIIESKWQELSGSADEKLVYLVENIRQCFPCPAIVIAGGGGMRPGAAQWLRRQVDGEKLQAVFTLEEFLTWANRSL